MKFVASYTIPAVTALGLLALLALLGSHAVITFALATSAILITGILHDYSPRRPRWEPQHRGFSRFPGKRLPVSLKQAA